nr:WbqC family protein [Bacteroidota bacterium]
MKELPVRRILPACPFPNLAWYKIALSEGEVLIDIHENYVKQTDRNRIFIADAHGAKFITLPVHRRNADSRSMSDVVFTEAMIPKVIMRHITTAYSSAPFFEHFERELMAFFEEFGTPGKSLLEFNLASLRWVEQMTDLKQEGGMVERSKYTEPVEMFEGDFRKKGALSNQVWSYKRYAQIFEDRNGFIEGRSVL